MTHNLLSSDRGHNIKKIELNEKRFNELKEKVDNKVDKIVKEPIKYKTTYTKHIIENTSFDDLMNGFLDTKKSKRKAYIKKNRKNFKNLMPDEQKKLFQVFYEYL